MTPNRAYAARCLCRLMSPQLREEVVLAQDVPQYGLLLGDMGTVVHVYPGGGLEYVITPSIDRAFDGVLGHTAAALRRNEYRNVRPRQLGERRCCRAATRLKQEAHSFGVRPRRAPHTEWITTRASSPSRL